LLGIPLDAPGQTSWGAALKLGALVAVLFFLMQAKRLELHPRRL